MCCFFSAVLAEDEIDPGKTKITDAKYCAESWLGTLQQEALTDNDDDNGT